MVIAEKTIFVLCFFIAANGSILYKYTPPLHGSPSYGPSTICMDFIITILPPGALAAIREGAKWHKEDAVKGLVQELVVIQP